MNTINYYTFDNNIVINDKKIYIEDNNLIYIETPITRSHFLCQLYNNSYYFNINVSDFIMYMSQFVENILEFEKNVKFLCNKNKKFISNIKENGKFKTLKLHIDPTNVKCYSKNNELIPLENITKDNNIIVVFNAIDIWENKCSFGVVFNITSIKIV